MLPPALGMPRREKLKTELPGFDLTRDPEFQRRTWVAQRVGRVAMAPAQDDKLAV